MASEGILASAGSGGGVLFARAYVVGAGVRRSQAAGVLWLAPVLGPEVVISELRPSVVHITGTKSGNVHNGSGLLLDQRHVLTAVHVVTDMDLDDVLHSPDAVDAPILNVQPHESVDIAIIEIDARRSAKRSSPALRFEIRSGQIK